MELENGGKCESLLILGMMLMVVQYKEFKEEHPGGTRYDLNKMRPAERSLYEFKDNVSFEVYLCDLALRFNFISGVLVQIV